MVPRGGRCVINRHVKGLEEAALLVRSRGVVFEELDLVRRWLRNEGKSLVEIRSLHSGSEITEALSACDE